MTQVYLFDTTLRDGTQGEGISLSVEDKLKIARRLDQFGVHYIEGGWPGSNPKDLEFFQRVHQLSLTHAKITAFGSTRRLGVQAHQDENLIRLIESKVPAVSIFGKAWDFHVYQALQTTLEENLLLIEESVRFLKQSGVEVIFDAEHFFDGYKNHREFAIACLERAVAGGADWITLCDTNGGSLPQEISQIVKDVVGKFPTPVGIHCHNDGELAVANSIAAVEAGARQVQGTINGIGERCGNANLCSVIPNLQLKLGYDCITSEQLSHLTKTARYVGEIANMSLPSNQPFVGTAAFAHKGGIHVSAIMKDATTYEHMKPEMVGNQRRVLVSELAGQSNLLFKAQELGLVMDKHNLQTKEMIGRIKQLEHQGYQFEGAEASLELLLKQACGQWEEAFELETFKILVEKRKDHSVVSEAIVKLTIHGHPVYMAAEGNGPVNALDNALRKALEAYYPSLKEMHLTDYKVRVLDEKDATAAKVRVLIESSNGADRWSTVGVSENIIEASWEALIDSIRYSLLGQQAEMKQTHIIKRAGVANH
jgi:2-isopropylmalate synthase